MVSKATNKMSSRRPPLHTCGLSFLEIVDNVCTKAQHLNGPIGSMAKKIARIASLASPFIYAFLYELLLIFSFLDDRIFALEYAVEAIFPPSGYAFDKIDELVRIAEILPGKFDEAVNKFPTIIHQVPFLDWALIRAIACLNFMLMQWGSGNMKEKEFLIDMNCNESSNKSGEDRKVDRKEESLNNEFKEDGGPKSGTVMKCTYKDALEKVIKTTYKDALEKGTKEDNRNEEKNLEGGIKKSIETNGVFKKTKNETRKKIKDQENTEKSSGSKEVNKDNKNANIMEKKISNGDQILELFESAWLASPSPRNMETSTSFSLSVSDQC